MDGLMLLGLLAVLVLMGVIGLCKSAGKADEDAQAERFMLQVEAFNWPERQP